MLAEPISVSGNGQFFPAQARLVDGNENAQKSGADIEAERQPDSAQTAEIVAEVQKNLDMFRDTDMHFSVHEASGQIMVIVRDEASGKVVREIPPKEALDLAAKLDAMIGLIFDRHG